MNSFQNQRLEKLRELLAEPQLSDGELVQQLSDFVESEVASAYGRGYRHGQQAGKPSALQAGKLRQKGRSAVRAK